MCHATPSSGRSNAETERSQAGSFVRPAALVVCRGRLPTSAQWSTRTESWSASERANRPGRDRGFSRGLSIRLPRGTTSQLLGITLPLRVLSRTSRCRPLPPRVLPEGCGRGGGDTSRRHGGRARGPQRGPLRSDGPVERARAFQRRSSSGPVGRACRASRAVGQAPSHAVEVGSDASGRAGLFRAHGSGLEHRGAALGGRAAHVGRGEEPGGLDEWLEACDVVRSPRFASGKRSFGNRSGCAPSFRSRR